MRWASKKPLKGFSVQIKAKRLALGLSTFQASQKAGISWKHYYNLESGETGPSLTSYISICRALGCELPMIDKPEETIAEKEKRQMEEDEKSARTSSVVKTFLKK